MKVWITTATIAALALCGCTRKGDWPANGFGASPGKGRYIGAGLYPVGRMWAQVVAADAPKDPAASQPKDDEEIIVVLDSATGEMRQCGNLSGACIAMNPWSKPLAVSHSAPVLLGKHADQLDDEAAAAAKRGQAQAK